MARTITLRADGGRRLALSWYAPGEAHRPHRHGHAQVSRLLVGDYEEDSPHGPRRAIGGTVSLKPAGFEHEDRFGEAGALILSLNLAEAPFIDRYVVDGEAPAGPASDPMNRSRTAVLSGASSAAAARALGLHPVRFAQLYRASFGEAPSASRQGRRLALAMAGIVAGDEPLAEVADAGGYADQAHMTRAVREATGLTPGGLRRLFAA